jgi:HK97 family phage major capsid protein
MTIEIKTLLDGIQKGFEDFKAANDLRLKAVEKGQSSADIDARLATIQADILSKSAAKSELEQLEARLNAKGLAGGGSGGVQDADQLAYKNAFFGRYVRKGDDGAELKGLQAKAVQIGVPSDGGLAVPRLVEQEIERLQRNVSPIRGIARVVTVGTSDYRKLVRTGKAGTGWVGETSARPETGTSSLQEVIPPIGEVYANPMVTQAALDDIYYDVEADITDDLTMSLAEAEGSAFVVGNGTNKPKGFLAYTTAATDDSTRAFGTLQHIITGVAGALPASNAGDVFLDVIAALKAGYRAGSQWVMPKAVMFAVMKLKDSTGQYLWQPTITGNSLGLNLLGFPVVECEDMPSIAANSLSVAFGNFQRGYTVVDRVGMRMLRDPYTNKPYVGFYTTKRVGGAVVNSEAIKVLRFSAT